MGTMRHATPLAALTTLARELESVNADVTREGAMLGKRIETIIDLLPVVGGAAGSTSSAEERAEIEETLREMHRIQEEISSAMRAELARIGGELAQLRAGQDAADGYTTAPATERSPQLNIVG